MRKLLITLMALLATTQLQAQTFSEWFRQKATQKRYLLEQIAALKVYSSYVKKGYDIGKKGLTAISDIKNGDFNLHRDFFSALRQASPEIRHYGPASDIILLQERILKISRQSDKLARASPELSAEEKQYFSGAMRRLLADCDRITVELQALTTGSDLSLKDDERIKRIDQLYAQTQDSYAFVRSFSAQYASLIASRKKMKTEVESSLKILGISK